MHTRAEFVLVLAPCLHCDCHPFWIVLGWGGVGKHVSAMLTLRDCHIFTEACQSPQDTSMSGYAVNHASVWDTEPARGCNLIDWQIFMSGLTPLTPKVFQPISFS